MWRTPVPELLTLVLIFSRLIPLFVSAQQQFHHWLHALPALEETERLLADCRAAAEPAGDRRSRTLAGARGHLPREREPDLCRSATGRLWME